MLLGLACSESSPSPPPVNALVVVIELRTPFIPNLSAPQLISFITREPNEEPLEPSSLPNKTSITLSLIVLGNGASRPLTIALPTSLIVMESNHALTPFIQLEIPPKKLLIPCVILATALLIGEVKSNIIPLNA